MEQCSLTRGTRFTIIIIITISITIIMLSIGKENKVHMHNFLDILLKHFIRVGDSLGQHDTTDIQEQLDFLCRIIFKVCQDVPDACGPLWGRTLKIFQSQLQKRLRDFVLGTTFCYKSSKCLLIIIIINNVRRAKHLLAKSWTFAFTSLIRSCVCSNRLQSCNCWFSKSLSLSMSFAMPSIFS